MPDFDEFYLDYRGPESTMKGIAVALCMLSALSACGKEPPPRSVAEFTEDPILLEATMVRCGHDRGLNRYDEECINAREAVGRLAAAEEQTRRQELEAQSEQKRQALRRAQQAAADARRRAQEAEQRRQEAEYFGEFEPLPPGEEQPESTDASPATDHGSADGRIERDGVEVPATDETAPEVTPEVDPRPAPGNGSGDAPADSSL